MTEDQSGYSDIPSGIVRERINELVNDYSDEELGAMLRAALVAQQHERRERVTTMESFRSWLRTVGLGWIAATSEQVARLWTTLKRFFS